MIRSLRALSLAAMALAACSGDETDKNNRASKNTGSLVVELEVADAIAAVVTGATVSLAPGSSAANVVIAEAKGAHTFENLSAATYVITAAAFAPNGNIIISTKTSVAVETGAVAKAKLLFEVDGDGLAITALTATNAAPMTSDTITLTASIAQSVTLPVTYAWTDDCAGEFISTNNATAVWQNKWAETCNVGLTVTSALASAQAAVSVTTKYATGTIVHLAGAVCPASVGTPGLALQGENGPATGAIFGEPHNILIAPNGDVVFTDREGGRVLRIDLATGKLHRVAGTAAGSNASSGDGGDALNAGMLYPISLAYDGAGNLYVGEQQGNRVRKISSATGTITTVAGDGSGANASPTAGAAATQTTVRTPKGLAVDTANNLYITSTSRNQIWKVYAASGTIATLANVAGQPFDLAFGMKGVLFTPARQGHKVYSLYPASGTTAIYAGTGSAGSAGGHGSPAADAEFDGPAGLGFIPGINKLLVADQNNRLIRLIGPKQNIRTVVGPGLNTLPGDGGVATSPLSRPADVAADAAGNLYIADPGDCSIKKVVGPY